jgi:hypothetical protein
MVQNFILNGLFCKPEELEIEWTQILTIGWLPESRHFQALDFGDTISCCMKTLALSM